jgi:hypothetical protein
VNSADPPAAEQGTVNLDVVIGGKNFKKGAVARFLVTGTEDPGGITVNSTTFKGPTQLIANITIADTATIDKFDIEVQNTSGRRGKGIELFSVKEKGSGAPEPTEGPIRFTLADPVVRGQGPERIASDGLGPYDVGVVKYEDDPNQQQVYALVDERKFFFDFGDEKDCPSSGCVHPFSETAFPYGEVVTNFQITGCDGGPRQVGLYRMASQEFQFCQFRINPSNPTNSGGLTTWFLRFQPRTASDSTWPKDAPATDADLVLVTCNIDNGNSADPRCTEWTVTATSPTDVGRLTRQKGGKRSWAGDYHMPFQMVITLKAQ